MGKTTQVRAAVVHVGAETTGGRWECGSDESVVEGKMDDTANAKGRTDQGNENDGPVLENQRRPTGVIKGRECALPLDAYPTRHGGPSVV